MSTKDVIDIYAIIFRHFNFRILRFLPLLLLLVLYNSYTLSAQSDTIILKDRIASLWYKGEIVYTDKSWGTKRIKELLYKIYKISSYDAKKDETIILTKNERKHILNELSRNKDFQWTNGLFENSKMISIDSIWTYLTVKRKAHYAKYHDALLQKDTIKLKQMHLYQPIVLSFSKPVYFRNNSICIGFFEWICGGDCGEYEVYIYRKLNDKWQLWFKPAQGVY